MESISAPSVILTSLNCLNGYERQIMAGVCRFALTRPDWTLVNINPDPTESVHLPDAHFDGVIGRVSGVLAEEIARLGLPTVVTSSGGTDGHGSPRVVPDNFAAGRLAAEHLMARKYRTFAFVGGQWQFAMERLSGFVDALATAGHVVSVFDGDGTNHAVWRGLRQPSQQDPVFARWIVSLPRPVGLLADRDETGVRVLKVCRESGVRVPEEFAVVGVDDDELLCQMCDPPMSSIALPAEQIGSAAAHLLSQMLEHPEQRAAREMSPASWTRLPPMRLVPRLSSRAVIVETPEVTAAASFIRTHVGKPIQVSDVVASVGTCRRTLERQYRLQFGHSIRHAIEQSHLDKAKALLIEPSLPLKTVAAQSGFTSVERFHNVFRRAEGKTPLAFRSAHVRSLKVS